MCYECYSYCISQMDVPTRNAYVQEVVSPDERSAASGVTNIFRSLGAATGPYFSTLLLKQPQYTSYPFLIAGGLKVVYDTLLLWSFKSADMGKKEQKTGHNKNSSIRNQELKPLITKA